MKEKLKKQKGITLIALIITIIVLLILAMVSIKLIWDGGIITHANNAVNQYNEVQNNEIQQLANAEEIMKQYGNNSNNPNWWDFREGEEEKIKYDSSRGGWMIADTNSYDDKKYAIIASLEGISGNESEAKDILMLWNDKYEDRYRGFWFILTDKVVNYMKDAGGINLEKYKWYRVNLPTANFEEYTEEAPLSVEEFSTNEIFCQSYLERIIASFNK